MITNKKIKMISILFEYPLSYIEADCFIKKLFENDKFNEYIDTLKINKNDIRILLANWINKNIINNNEEEINPQIKLKLLKIIENFI